MYGRTIKSLGFYKATEVNADEEDKNGKSKKKSKFKHEKIRKEPMKVESQNNVVEVLNGDIDIFGAEVSDLQMTGKFKKKKKKKKQAKNYIDDLEEEDYLY